MLKTMTRRDLQEMDNVCVLELYRQFTNDVQELPLKGIRLRTCQATVYETSKYYILKSYNTVVAFIIKDKDILVDILRLVYGHTNTSAKHIAKFNTDYGRAKFGCIQRLTYREV